MKTKEQIKQAKIDNALYRILMDAMFNKKIKAKNDGI